MLAVAGSSGRCLLRGALGLWLRPAVLQQRCTSTSHVLHSWHDRGAQGSTSIPYTSHHGTLRPSWRLCSGLATKLPSALGSFDEVPPKEETGSGEPKTAPSSDESALAKARRLARFDEEGEYRVFRELLEGKRTRFVSRVSYDGTNYKGFQLQSGLPTVQVRGRWREHQV